MNAPLSSLPGRYRLTPSLAKGAGAEQWFALDSDSGRHVIVARMPRDRAACYQAVQGEKHPHLAGVLEVVDEPGSVTAAGASLLPSSLVIVEFVPGRTLSGLLRRGPIHPFKAVAWLLRLADAVGTLHRRGAAHGAICSRSVVVEPVGRAVPPIQAQLVCPTLGSYCSPARLEGSGPGPLDDLWALHVLLYLALTGSPPFSGKREALLRQIRGDKPQPLSKYGIQEPVLQGVLDRGLSADESHRTADIAELSRALDAWESGRQPEPRPRNRAVADARGPASPVGDDVIVLDEGTLPAQDSLEVPEDDTVRMEVEALPAAELAVSAPEPGPAPEPVQEANQPARRAAPAAHQRPPPLPMPAGTAGGGSASTRWRLWGGIGLVAALLAIGTFYGVLSSSRPAPAPSAEPSSAPAAAEGSASATAARAELPDRPEQQLRACVVSYFPQDAFQGTPEFGFLCQDEDLRKIALSLFPPLVSRETADAGAPAPSKGPAGLVVRGSAQEELGWYELVATTVVRSACCKDVPLPVLPKTEGFCQQLQAEVRNIAAATRKSGDLAPYARRFEDAVVCLFATGTTRPYRYEKAPADAHRRAFQVFLKHAAESDMVRSRMPWLR